MADKPKWYSTFELRDMPVAAIRKLCRERGWVFYYLDKLKKAELIEKFEAEQRKARAEFVPT